MIPIAIPAAKQERPTLKPAPNWIKPLNKVCFKATRIASVSKSLTLHSYPCLLTTTGKQDTDNDTINTQDTSHDNGDNTLDQKVRTKNTHSRETNTRFGSAIRGSETLRVKVISKRSVRCPLEYLFQLTAKDNGSSAAHGAKERCVNGTRVVRVRHMNGHARKKTSVGDEKAITLPVFHIVFYIKGILKWKQE